MNHQQLISCYGQVTWRLTRIIGSSITLCDQFLQLPPFSRTWTSLRPDKCLQTSHTVVWYRSSGSKHDGQSSDPKFLHGCRDVGCAGVCATPACSSYRLAWNWSGVLHAWMRFFVDHFLGEFLRICSCTDFMGLEDEKSKFRFLRVKYSKLSNISTCRSLFAKKGCTTEKLRWQQFFYICSWKREVTTNLLKFQGDLITWLHK